VLCCVMFRTHARAELSHSEAKKRGKSPPQNPETQKEGILSRFYAPMLPNPPPSQEKG